MHAALPGKPAIRLLHDRFGLHSDQTVAVKELQVNTIKFAGQLSRQTLQM